MINDQAGEYQRLLQELRHRYKQRYNVSLDDELLYLIIRMNEMQVALKGDIKAIERITFRKGSDYFWYGAGRSIGFLFAGVGLMLIGLYLVNRQDNISYPAPQTTKSQHQSRDFLAPDDKGVYYTKPNKSKK